MRTIGEIRLALSQQLADATKRHDTLLTVASGLKQLGRKDEARSILDEVSQLRGAIRSIRTACDHLAPLAPIAQPLERVPVCPTVEAFGYADQYGPDRNGNACLDRS